MGFFGFFFSGAGTQASPSGAAKAAPALKPALSPPFADVELTRAKEEGERWVVPRSDGTEAVLTLDAELQAHVANIFEKYDVPAGGVVALDPKTGRVLAYVGYEAGQGQSYELLTDPAPPAASVFKIITAAALLDQGVETSTSVCYGGGLRGLSAADLADNPKRDRWCATLSEAMGSSINAIFAKLADRHLNANRLQQYASAFGFGQRLPFDLPAEPSPIDVPESRIERARMAAGFWHSHLSPLHGALLAATIANDGNMPRAGLVEEIRNPEGKSLYTFNPETFRAVLPRQTARLAGQMMTRTVTHGTARKAFRDPSGRPFLPGVQVAGKTGTLSRSNPYRRYTWWVGYAPVDDPKIAVASLVVNEPKWRIKASYVARETLRHYLMEQRN